MLTRIVRRARPCDPRDAGFSLVEVVVAMVVFAVTVTAVLGVMVSIFGVTRANTHRVAAANLATKQIESTRSMRTLDIPDGAVTRDEIVAGTTFTLTQTANYAVSGSATSVCEGTGDQLAYKVVNVTVTWPNMGSVKPVRSDTLKALGLGADGLDSTRGSLAVAVTNANGGKGAGIVVTLMPGNITRTTGPDGCAVFVGLLTGQSYTATANKPGNVSHLNTQVATLTQGVQAGRVARAALLYDTARTVGVTWRPPVGHVALPGIPLRYRSTYVSDGAMLPACAVVGNACTTGVPGEVRYLFPAIYDFSGGSCKDARGGTQDVDLVGSNGAVSVPLAGYRVRVEDDDKRVVPAQLVTVRHSSDSDPTGCTAGETYQLNTGATGTALVALPFGEWTFSAPGAESETDKVKPGGGVRTVVLELDEDD